MVKKRKRTWPKRRPHDDARDVLNVARNLLSTIPTASLKRLEGIGPRDARGMVRGRSGAFRHLNREQHARLSVWSGRMILLAAQAIIDDREQEIAFWERCEEQGFK